MPLKNDQTILSFLAGGGELGQLTRTYNWAAHPLGVPEYWPQSLKTTLSIILNSKFPMFLWWGPQLYCFYNDAYRPSLGNMGKHPSILGKPAREAWPEIWPVISPLIEQVLAGGEATWSEDQLIPIYRNGGMEDVYWTFSYSPVRDEGSTVAGVFVTCTETTEKINTLKSLRQGRDDLEFVLDAAGLGAWDLNPATNKFTGNSRLKEWFGLQPYEEIDLELAINAIAVGDRASVAAAIQWALTYESGGDYEIEYLICNPKSKKETYVRARGKALFNDDKIPYRFSGTLQDITSERKAIITLEESNQRLEIALDAGSLGITEVDLATGTMNSNPQFKKNYGYPADDSFDYPELFNMILPQYQEEVKELFGFAKDNNTVYEAEYEVRWPDGSLHWIRAHGRPRYDENGQANRMVGVTEDITEQVNARMELEAAKEKFQMIADNISQLAWMADETGSIFWYNQRWFDYTATTLEEMKGWGWQKIHHVDHVERVTQKFKQHVASVEVWEDTFPIKGANGEYRWFLSRAVPIRNEKDRSILWFGTNTDITEQRRLEQQKDEFISIASHELKTPVTSLKVSLQLIERMKDAPTPALPRLVDQATRSMHKMTGLIDELLNANRINEGQLRLVKKTFLIDDLVRACCNNIRENNKQQMVMSGDTGIEVNADEHRIEQVIENFINNAIKYAPNSDKVELIITREQRQVRVAVKDHGPGIPAGRLPHLFNRYYRADYSGAQYSGLGLGLYICSEIIKRHNGRIGVDSQPGEGSSFWFTLPLK